MKISYLRVAAMLVACQVLSPTLIQAQASPASKTPATETVSGRIVIRADGGPPQKNTRIWIFDEKSGKEYATPVNAKGEFMITLPEGYYVVLIASLGFNPYAKEISLEHGNPVKLMVKQDADSAVLDSYVTCCR